MASPDITTTVPTVQSWRADVLARIAAGQRFAALYGTSAGDGCDVSVLLVGAAAVDRVHVIVPVGPNGVLAYPALTPDVPAARWYEQALHDLSGVIPIGHPRLDPLLLPLTDGDDRPLPGHGGTTELLHPADEQGPVDVAGHGMFTIPFGPVRSGVAESIEFLIETPGEDVPHLTIRPHYKHRGIAKRFEGLPVDDGVLVAERVEGIATVAHALAFCHAVESLADTRVPVAAGLLRVVFAELERIANHLDVAMRLTDAAGLAVATAWFGWHKEITMRLTSAACGSRFGRGVIVPGGVRDGLRVEPAGMAREVARLHVRIRADAAALMNTASFLDRLRGTGRLDPATARAYGALGPVGRGSGFDDDHRRYRSYDGYRMLPPPQLPDHDAGDATARLRVRWVEIDSAVALIQGALTQLEPLSDQPMNVAVTPRDGFAAGWAEAAQGETLYGLELYDGRIRRCLGRSASLHNLVLFPDTFNGDVLTDFAFIEASFGLSYAGVAM